VLDFQLREHEKFLSRFVREYRDVDSDNDGVVDEAGFRQLMQRLQVVSEEQVERFLISIDPFNNQRVTFSQVVQLLSQEVVRAQDGSECAILELIANHQR